MSTREVLLDGGSPWGFRMHGGADCGLPLKISRVNPGSKAAQRGVREGDVITTINNQSAKSITNSDAHALLRNAGETLLLGLNEDSVGSPKRRTHRTHEQKTDSSSNLTTTKTTAIVNDGVPPRTALDDNEKGGLSSESGLLTEPTVENNNDTRKRSRSRKKHVVNQLSLEPVSLVPCSSMESASIDNKRVLSPCRGNRSRGRRARRARVKQRRRRPDGDEESFEGDDVSVKSDQMSVRSDKSDQMTVNSDEKDQMTVNSDEDSKKTNNALVNSNVKDTINVATDNSMKASIKIDQESRNSNKDLKISEHKSKKSAKPTKTHELSEECNVSTVLIAASDKQLDVVAATSTCLAAAVEEIVISGSVVANTGVWEEVDTFHKEVEDVVVARVEPVMLGTVEVAVDERVVANKGVCQEVEDVVVARVESVMLGIVEVAVDERVVEIDVENIIESVVHESIEVEIPVLIGSINVEVKDSRVEESLQVIEVEDMKNSVEERIVEVGIVPVLNENVKVEVKASRVDESEVEVELKSLEEIQVDERAFEEVVEVEVVPVIFENVNVEVKASCVDETEVDVDLTSLQDIQVEEVKKNVVEEIVEVEIIPVLIEAVKVDVKASRVDESEVEVDLMGLEEIQVEKKVVEEIVKVEIVPVLIENVNVEVKASRVDESVVENELTSLHDIEVEDLQKINVEEIVDVLPEIVQNVNIDLRATRVDECEVDIELRTSKDIEVEGVAVSVVEEVVEVGGCDIATIMPDSCVVEDNKVKPRKPQVLDINKLELVMEKNKATKSSKMLSFVKELDMKIAEIKNKTCGLKELEKTEAQIEAVTNIQYKSNQDISYTEELPITTGISNQHQMCDILMESDSGDVMVTKTKMDISKETQPQTMKDIPRVEITLDTSTSLEDDCQLTSEEEILLDPSPAMSNLEEKTLRQFLHSLNLCEPLEEQPSVLFQRQVSEELPSRCDIDIRQPKRQQSEDFYVPHQRYLEVILEENSDIVDNDKRLEQLGDELALEVRTHGKRGCHGREDTGRVRNRSWEDTVFDPFLTDIKLIPSVDDCSDWQSKFDDFRDRQSEELRAWVRNCRPLSEAPLSLPEEVEPERHLPRDRESRKNRSWEEAVFIVETDEMDDGNEEVVQRVELPESGSEEETRQGGDVEIVYIDSSGSLSPSELQDKVKEVVIHVVLAEDNVASGSNVKDTSKQIDVTVITEHKEHVTQPSVNKGVETHSVEKCQVFQQDICSPESQGSIEDTFNEFAAIVTSGLQGTMERFTRSISTSKQEDQCSYTKLDKEFEEYVLGTGDYQPSLFVDDVTKKPEEPKRSDVISPESVLAVPPCFSRQQSSSSDATSQNTIILNSPPSSNIEPTPAPVLHTHSEPHVDVPLVSPRSLKLLCIGRVISMPYGVCILQQVGFLSKDFDSSPFAMEYERAGKSTSESSNQEDVTYTKTLLIGILNYDEEQRQIAEEFKPQSSKPESDSQTQRHSYHDEISEETPPPVLATSGPDAWLGTPTLQQPNVLVCLSPAQRRSYHDGDVPTPEEAQRLLELHRIFSERRGHHENDNKKQFQSTNQYDAVQNTPHLGGGFFTTKKTFIEKRNSLPDMWSSKSSNHDSISGEIIGEDLAMNQSQYETLLKYNEYQHVSTDNTVCTEENLDYLEKQLLILADNNDRMERELLNQHTISDETSEKVTTSSPPVPVAVVTSPDVKIPPCEREHATGEQLADDKDATSRQILAIIQVTDEEDDHRLLNKQKYFTSSSYKSNMPEEEDTASYKVHILADWLQHGRDEYQKQKETPLIDEDEIKKDFKETFSYWTQRERGIVDVDQDEKKNTHQPKSFLDRKASLPESKEIQKTNEKVKEHQIQMRDSTRRSLPRDQFEKQLKSVQDLDRHDAKQKLDDELRRVVDHRRYSYHDRKFDAKDFKISKQGDIAVNQNAEVRPRSLADGEVFRQQMYHEYMNQVAQRAERRKQKVLKISAIPNSADTTPSEDAPENQERKLSVTLLENEFMGKVKERMDKLGINHDDEEDGGYERRLEEDLVSCSEISDESLFYESSVLEDYVIEGDVRMMELPRHLQEYLALTSGHDEDDEGVWSPGQQSSSNTPVASSPNSVGQHVSRFEYQRPKEDEVKDKVEEDAIPVVWTPRSAGASPQLERKEFRPLNFESPTLKRKTYKAEETSPAPPPSWEPPLTFPTRSSPAVNHHTNAASTRIASTLEQRRDVVTTSLSTSERRLTSSKSAPASGLYALTSTSNLPRVQSPTITLLQKAREGQLPRGAHYLDQSDELRNYTTSKSDYESDSETKRKAEPRPKIEGIGPTTKDGMPIVLRSEVKDENHGKWYRKMYDSLHRAGKDGKYPYSSAGGYLSEPDHSGYDSEINNYAKYATLDRRRIKNKENDYTSSLPRSRYTPHPDAIKYATDIYKSQPGRIENYQPGNSSISDKETKQWWDEVLDIFDGAAADQQKQNQQTLLEHQRYTSTHTTGKSFMSHALKESGYESDSTLVFKRRDDNQSALSPVEHKMAYKSIQKGGEAPLHGFRKMAPERPKESPHRYVESEVTIHYRSPVRAEAKEALGEEELACIQAEAMRRIYQEERRRKYLQELQDMNSRRHTDNFTPSQKSPIPLNRYDDFFDDVPPVRSKSRERTPEPKLVARALYNFQGQTSRELSFRRGDVIFVRKQIDKNWYEGEHNAMIGLFPFNYVEIIPYDPLRTMPRKNTEGQARAKFNFIAQTHLELSLVKGELVVLTRRVDDNWYEGRISNRKGIFPVSYVNVLCEPGERPVTPLTLSTSKPIAAPAAHSLIINGQQQSLNQHHYVPPEASTNYYSQTKSSPYSSLQRNVATSKAYLAPVNQTLHIDTRSDPIPYRALYNYRPQNDDELELKEGDTVFVMEKCDDGWYVGSSQRTGYFGTFPGNYVERI